jgi:hypothetical protein
VPTTSSLEILEPFVVKKPKMGTWGGNCRETEYYFEFSVLFMHRLPKIDQEAQGLYSVEHNYAYVDYMLTDDKSAPSIRCVPTGIWLNSENS